jgi:hypothetical protein
MQAINDRGVMVGYSGEENQPARFEPGGARTVLDPSTARASRSAASTTPTRSLAPSTGRAHCPGEYPVAWDAAGHGIDLRTMIWSARCETPLDVHLDDRRTVAGRPTCSADPGYTVISTQITDSGMVAAPVDHRQIVAGEENRVAGAGHGA